MQQYSDLVFEVMLKHIRNNLLNLKDINILNAQVVLYFLNSNFINTVIIVQKNRTKYLINCLQALYFAFSQNLDLILFLAKH